jgi:hypothetical protein
MLLTYFLNDFEMLPVAPIITGITRAFTFHFIIIIIIIIRYYSYQTVSPACQPKQLSDIALQRSTKRSDVVLSTFRLTEVPGVTFSPWTV